MPDKLSKCFFIFVARHISLLRLCLCLEKFYAQFGWLVPLCDSISSRTFPNEHFSAHFLQQYESEVLSVNVSSDWTGRNSIRWLHKVHSDGCFLLDNYWGNEIGNLNEFTDVCKKCVQKEHISSHQLHLCESYYGTSSLRGCSHIHGQRPNFHLNRFQHIFSRFTQGRLTGQFHHLLCNHIVSGSDFA